MPTARSDCIHVYPVRVLSCRGQSQALSVLLYISQREIVEHVRPTLLVLITREIRHLVWTVDFRSVPRQTASAIFDIFFLCGPTPSANDRTPIFEEPLRSCALTEEK